MALAKAIVGARHTPQQVTWLRDDGSAEDLRGATLSGKIYDIRTGAERNMDGQLSLVTPASGVFLWAYGAEDVKTTGSYSVQFTATYTDQSLDKTYITTWHVEPSL
jgi:hypothetical protein